MNNEELKSPVSVLEKTIQDNQIKETDNVTAIRKGIESLLINLYGDTQGDVCNAINTAFSSPLVTCHAMSGINIKSNSTEVEIRFILNTKTLDRIKSLKQHQEIIEKELKELSK